MLLILYMIDICFPHQKKNRDKIAAITINSSKKDTLGSEETKKIYKI